MKIKKRYFSYLSFVFMLSMKVVSFGHSNFVVNHDFAEDKLSRGHKIQLANDDLFEYQTENACEDSEEDLEWSKWSMGEYDNNNVFSLAKVLYPHGGALSNHGNIRPIIVFVNHGGYSSFDSYEKQEIKDRVRVGLSKLWSAEGPYINFWDDSAELQASVSTSCQSYNVGNTPTRSCIYDAITSLKDEEGNYVLTNLASDYIKSDFVSKNDVHKAALQQVIDKYKNWSDGWYNYISDDAVVIFVAKFGANGISINGSVYINWNHVSNNRGIIAHEVVHSLGGVDEYKIGGDCKFCSAGNLACDACTGANEWIKFVPCIMEQSTGYADKTPYFLCPWTRKFLGWPYVAIGDSEYTLSSFPKYENVVGYKSGTDNYFFGHGSDKSWMISKVDVSNGKLDSVICNRNFSNFYKSIAFFKGGGKNYLFMQRDNDKRWYISEILSGCSWRDAKYGNWGNFYETVVPFVENGKNYLYGQRKRDGFWFISEMSPSTGWGNDYTGSWSKFYPVSLIFNDGSKNFLFAHAYDGSWLIQEIKSNYLYPSARYSGSFNGFYHYMQIISYKEDNYLLGSRENEWFVKKIDQYGLYNNIIGSEFTKDVSNFYASAISIPESPSVNNKIVLFGQNSYGNSQTRKIEVGEFRPVG